MFILFAEWSGALWLRIEKLFRADLGCFWGHKYFPTAEILVSGEVSGLEQTQKLAKDIGLQTLLNPKVCPSGRDIFSLPGFKFRILYLYSASEHPLLFNSLINFLLSQVQGQQVHQKILFHQKCSSHRFIGGKPRVFYICLLQPPEYLVYFSLSGQNITGFHCFVFVLLSFLQLVLLSFDFLVFGEKIDVF